LRDEYVNIRKKSLARELLKEKKRVWQEKITMVMDGPLLSNFMAPKVP
jgi:hypothetical protein